ncbi:MAG: hypothetical protein ACI8PZ_005268 [Myxococcota bacterium]|jgi:hypothetical protein
MRLLPLLLATACTRTVCPEGYGLVDELCYPIQVPEPSVTADNDADSDADSDADTDADADADTDADTDADADTDTDTDTVGHTGDTGPTSTDTSWTNPDLGTVIAWSAWSAGCVGPDWLVQAVADGALGTVRANVWETDRADGRNEEHLVPLLTETVAEGLLTGGADPFLPGSSTRFICGDHDTRGALTWAMRAYDLSGTLVDCVAWGHDPHGVKRSEYGTDQPVTSQPELVGCRVP